MRFLKLLGAIAFLCMLILIGSLLAFIYFTDINRLKPFIVSEFKQTTGLILKIDGDLSWSLYPELGFAMKHLTLIDPGQGAQNQLAEINQLAVGVAPFSILHGRIQIESLTAKELIVYAGKSALRLAISCVAKGYFDLVHSSLHLSQIEGTVNNMKVKGESIFTHPAGKTLIEGQFTVQTPDLKKWLQQAGVQNTSLQSATDLQGKLQFTSQTNFHSLNLTGHFKLKELKLESLTTNNLQVQARLKNSLLTLSPIKSDLYQGSFNGLSTIDFNRAEPRIQFQGALSNVQTAGMLAGLTGPSKIRLKGRGNLQFKITTLGNTSSVLIRNLNGSGSLKVGNGTLSGLDMLYLVFTAYALVTQQPPPKASSDNTSFSSVTASFNIRNGVIANNDFNLTSALLLAKGKGTLDLVARKINYQILASMRQGANQQAANLPSNLLNFVLPLKNTLNLSQLTIPIQISGNFDNPKVAVDMKTVLAEVVKQKAAGVVTGKVLQSVVPGLQVLPFLPSLPAGH